jgi:hypothetical protein
MVTRGAWVTSFVARGSIEKASPSCHRPASHHEDEEDRGNRGDPRPAPKLGSSVWLGKARSATRDS